MKQLTVRFSETQRLSINDVSEVIGVKFSLVARSAMRLGMMQIKTLAANDLEKAKDLILINDARSK